MKFVSIFLFLGTMVSLVASQAGDVPQQINFQGILTDGSGSPLANVTRNVQFTIYDALAGGNSKWSENQNVSTDGSGRFQVTLGLANAISDSVFRDRPRYLGVKVESDAELSPRTQIASVGYAQKAQRVTTLDGSLGGIISGDVTIQSSLSVTGGGSTIYFNAGTSGDLSAQLPSNSLSAPEISDEPGIASNKASTFVTLNTLSMTDLITISLTIPAPGYVVVEGKCYLELYGTTAFNYADAQIDQTAGGGASQPYFTFAGLPGYSNIGSAFFPVFVTRTYYFGTAGTYTFRLEALAVNGGGSASARAQYPMITAVYYPTAYGGVAP